MNSLANATDFRDHKPDGSGTFDLFGACPGQAKREQEKFFMGSTADKIKGATNEAIGKAKQGVGEAAGSDRLPLFRKSRARARRPWAMPRKPAAAANKTSNRRWSVRD